MTYWCVLQDSASQQWKKNVSALTLERLFVIQHVNKLINHLSFHTRESLPCTV